MESRRAYPGPDRSLQAPLGSCLNRTHRGSLWLSLCIKHPAEFGGDALKILGRDEVPQAWWGSST